MRSFNNPYIEDYKDTGNNNEEAIFWCFFITAVILFSRN